MPTENETNTGGGAVIAGDVGTGGGEFVGHDDKRIENEFNLNFSSEADRLILFHLNQLSLRLSFVERDILDMKTGRYQRWFQTLLVALALLLLVLGGVVLLRMK